MNAAVNEEEIESTSQDGPGKRLRRGREQQGLELERAAALLHLSEEKLIALEADDYQDLPGAVFVQGYLRNYARLLNMPVEPLLGMFHKLNKDYDRPPELHISQVRHEVRSSHLLVRLMTWLIVIVLIALVVIWWRGYLQWPLSMSPPAEQTPAAVFAEPQPAEEQVPSPEADSAYLAVPDDTGQATLSLPRPAETVPSLADAPTEPSSEPDNPVLLDSTAPPLPEPGSGSILLPLPAAPAADEQAQAPLASTEVIAVPSPEPAVTPAAGRIVVTFSDTSWTEIRDASGSFKILGEVGAGTRRVLGGRPPYKVVLGNAAGVSITVDGKPFDLTPHVRGKVARFSLDLDR